MKQIFQCKKSNRAPIFPAPADRLGGRICADLALENAQCAHAHKKMLGFSVTTSSFENEKTVTLKTGSLTYLSHAKKRAASRACKELLHELLTDKNISSIAPVTVICLGNSSVSVDSFGPLCAKRIYATRHLKNELPELFSALGGTEITVITAGVTAETGVNPLEIAKTCVKELNPSLIITVDALKASRTENLLSVIQISSGVTPGSGTDSSRPEISESTLGVPVISIGVPTVISSLTLANDLQNNRSIAPATHQNAKLHPKYSKNHTPLLVSLPDSESEVNTYAKVVADAVNLLLLGAFFD